MNTLNTLNTLGRLTWCFLLLSMVTTVTTSMSALAASPTVAMAPATVLPAAELNLVKADLVAALAAVSSVRALSLAETTSLFTRAAREGIACDPREAPCAARVAAFGGIDFMVVADVGPDAAALALVDGRDGRVVRRRQAPLAAATRRAGLFALVGSVVTDGPVMGRLRVDGPPGLALQVDGAMAGTAPLEVALEAGPHDVNGVRVLVPAAGLVVVARLADTDGGSTLGTAALVTTVGGVALGLVGGIGAAVVAPAVDQRRALSASAWNNAVTTGRALVAVAAVGVGLVVLGTGMWVTVGSGDDDTDIDTDTDTDTSGVAESRP